MAKTTATNTSDRPVIKRGSRHNSALETKLEHEYKKAPIVKSKSGLTKEQDAILEKDYTPNPAVAEQRGEAGRRVSLRQALARKADFSTFREWIVGDFPLITHAWSHKAKIEMLQKQAKAIKRRDARDPDADFVSSLYPMGEDGRGKKIYGFPATGVKKCLVSAAHKDKGVEKTKVLGGLWLDAQMVRVMPAFAGAICDMPLVRIYGSDPEMREDMVRIGTGQTKTAQLAYRAQFTYWAILLRGRFNQTSLPEESLAFLIQEGGTLSGLGEWRNEKSGVFGSFHLASPEEEEAWNAFATGKGPVPKPENFSGYAEAAE